MKKLALILFVYIIGCVASYSTIKSVISREFDGEWTNEDRIFTAAVSVFSWPAAIAGGVILALNTEGDLSAKAKW